jgi:hypothetical protein
MEPTIAYQCTAPSHRTGDAGPDKLTVHAGEWAFCPYDAKAEGHQWVSSGGLTLPMLRHAAILRRTEAKEGA